MVLTGRESKRVRYLVLLEVAGTYVTACFFLGFALSNIVPQLSFAFFTERGELVGTTYQFFHSFHDTPLRPTALLVLLTIIIQHACTASSGMTAGYLYTY
jgi:hypothetical protein